MTDEVREDLRRISVKSCIELIHVAEGGWGVHLELQYRLIMLSRSVYLVSKG